MSGGLVEILAGSSEEDASSDFLVGVCEAVFETSRVGSCAGKGGAKNKKPAARSPAEAALLRRCAAVSLTSLAMTVDFMPDLLAGAAPKPWTFAAEACCPCGRASGCEVCHARTDQLSRVEGIAPSENRKGEERVTRSDRGWVRAAAGSLRRFRCRLSYAGFPLWLRH